MSASARTGYEQLAPDQAERVDLACDRFEQAWKQGARPTLEGFVGAAAGTERLALLQELILIDLNYRCRAGERPTPDDYQRFNELPTDWLARELAALGPPRDIGNRLPTAPGYEIITEVGRGGMGVVYRARDVRRDRPVALKVLRLEAAADPRYLERFRREARAASALQHPHVCALYECGEHQGQPYLVLEWIEGRTLRALLGTQPDLPRLLPVLRQAADALSAAHAAGIVHRDVKPENLMVRPDGYVKVLDFGLARWLQPTTPSFAGRPVTDSGMLLGTPWYMSPEQSRGKPVGSASDVFSLGIVLYEVVTGMRPFATLDAIAAQPVYPPSRLHRELPAPLEALILHMLEKDPRRRPAMPAVETELARVIAEMTPTPAVAGCDPAFDLWRQARRALLRGELSAALARARQCLELAEARNEPGLRTEAYLLLGAAHVHQAELPAALHHLERCLALADAQRDIASTLRFAHPGVVACGYLAGAQWLLGFGERALAATNQAFTLAEHARHPPTLIEALGSAAHLHALRRDVPRALKAGHKAARLAREHEDQLGLARGLFWYGWALARQGKAEEGCVRMQRGLALVRKIEAAVLLPPLLGALAETLLERGGLDAARPALAEALTLCAAGQGQFDEAELYRLQAELLLRSPGETTQVEQAEAWFRRSLETARQRGFKAWELRAATGLARLLSQQGRAVEGRQLLAERCTGFTEGWNSPDLRAALDLLTALS